MNTKNNQFLTHFNQFCYISGIPALPEYPSCSKQSDEEPQSMNVKKQPSVMNTRMHGHKDVRTGRRKGLVRILPSSLQISRAVKSSLSTLC